MSDKNWDIVIRLKLFFLMFVMLLALHVILGGSIFELDINWKTIVIFSLVFGVFSANRYKKMKIQIPIEDKASFSIFLRNYLECTGLKIISENNDVFIVKPKFNWTYRWISNERIILTVEENQAILTGPSHYVEKIKILINAIL